MSAIPKNASDSEDDPDFVPHDETDSSDEEPDLKRARTSSPKPTAEEQAADKRARELLWKSFQASVGEPERKSEDVPKKMVKIEKRYIFAGEHTVEIVEVLEDSADAKKWPLYRAQEVGTLSSSHDPPLLGDSASTSTTVPAKRKPGPRKSRASLPDIPNQKPRKLSTLDKSAMDWRAHINSNPPEMKDELDANRRGGGYLEKVEFLHRVEARKEDVFEANKSAKRRR
ncbi:bucentaur or craniofacial development-domain-containing protein [Mycena pura]|uniref:SWR1-complex protein 5 n=1 Tax=Mycena pura TaxID=153505 RepID=A0AAD6V463_9AGAR|nr:bucentaur or craniofacial development-domain-containing protein [Mycena pura]